MGVATAPAGVVERPLPAALVARSGDGTALEGVLPISAIPLRAEAGGICGSGMELACVPEGRLTLVGPRVKTGACVHSGFLSYLPAQPPAHTLGRSSTVSWNAPHT